MVGDWTGGEWSSECLLFVFFDPFCYLAICSTGNTFLVSFIFFRLFFVSFLCSLVSWPIAWFGSFLLLLVAVQPPTFPNTLFYLFQQAID